MDEELDLLELFYAFWRRKIWLIIAVIIGAIFGYLYTNFLVVPKYSSSVNLILSKPAEEKAGTIVDATGAITQSDIALNQKLISTYGEIMKSRSVSTKVIENLSLDMTYAELRKCISVSSVKDTDVMKLSITTLDPELSARVADEMVKVFTDEVARIYNIKNVSVIDGAVVDHTPVNVNYVKNMAIFAMIGLVLVAVIIFLNYYFDNTIKTEESVQQLTGLPVLSSIPNINTEQKGGK